MQNTQQGPDLATQNATARDIVLRSSTNMWQQIFAVTPSGTIPGQIINVPVRNVGLIKRFLVKITGTVVQGAAETQNLTKIGLANLLSNVQFTDLSNNVRINTAGWHLHYVATGRRQMAFGAAFTNDSPTGIASNYSVIKATAAVTTVLPFTMYYELPVSYGDFDLRGAIYANIVSATMNLQFTFNPNFWLASTADETLGVYKSTTAQLGTLAITGFTVYQNYLDQLPVQQNGQPLLPVLDTSHSYLLQNTAFSGIAANSDFPIQYANFRQFMSTIVIYDNQALNLGTDINYFSLVSANYTNIIKLDPITMKLIYEREIFNDDLPAGVYYFDTRLKPIITTQQGNMQLNLNPSNVAGVASQILVGFEMMAVQNQIINAGSLPGS